MENQKDRFSIIGLLGVISLVFALRVNQFESLARSSENGDRQNVKHAGMPAALTRNQTFKRKSPNTTQATLNPCGFVQQNAQTTTNPIYYDRLYTINSEESIGFVIFPIADGYYVISGHGTSGGFFTGGGAIKFNQQGMPVNSKDFSYGNPAGLRDVTQTIDGKYLAGGYLIKPRFEGILGKSDSDLTPLWIKSMSITNYDTFIAGVESTVDNGVLALAREKIGFGILKFDGNGNLSWKKRVKIAMNDWFTDVFAIRENYYYDASHNKHCGGYIIFGSVYRDANNSDLYLAAVSCDGSTIHWQRIIGGSSWDGSLVLSEEMYAWASNIILVADNNGENTQNATYAVAATTNSYGQNVAIVIVPFTISGNTTLNSSVSFGQIKLLDGSNQDIVHGGGVRFMKLSDGNVLLIGETDSFGAGDADIFLIKMDTSFIPIWQSTYGTTGDEVGIGISETTSGIQVAGSHENAAVLMSLESDGTNQGLCIERNSANFTVTNLSPTITTPTYTVDDGTLIISNNSFSLSDTETSITCPQFLYTPSVFR
jgi:hypothetical protein